MFGSDWPVLTEAGCYDQWCDIVLNAGSRLSDDERRRVLSGTATYDPVNRTGQGGC